MKVFFEGKWTHLPKPQAMERGKIVRSIFTLDHDENQKNQTNSIITLIKRASMRLHVIYLSLRHDGVRETIDRAKNMTRRENALSPDKYKSCFVGHLDDEEKIVAGISLNHTPHSEFVAVRDELVYAIGKNTPLFLASLLPYGSALTYLCETSLKGEVCVNVIGQGVMRGLAGLILSHYNISIYKDAPDTQSTKCLVVSKPNEISSFNGFVFGLGLSQKTIDEFYPNAKSTDLFSLGAILNNNDLNIDVYYDLELDLPEWLQSENILKYLKIISNTKLALTSELISGIADAENLSSSNTAKILRLDEITKLVSYGLEINTADTIKRAETPSTEREKSVKYVSLIGGGRWPLGMSIRHMCKDKNIRLRYVCDRRPEVAHLASLAFPFEYTTTNIDKVLSDTLTDIVVVAPYHGFHAPIASKVLAAGKACYVEKPPAINMEQFNELFSQTEDNHQLFHIGYNRRFAPATKKLLEILNNETGPVNINMVIRSVDIPLSSWYYWPSNGSRVISNVCHFTDFAYLLTNHAAPVSVSVSSSLVGRPDENAVITVLFEDGSVANIFYTNKGFHKGGYDQRYQIMKGSITAWIDNFESLTVRRNNTTQKVWAGIEDMGHRNQMREVTNCILQDKPAPIPIAIAKMSARIYLAAMESVKQNGNVVQVQDI